MGIRRCKRVYPDFKYFFFCPGIRITEELSWTTNTAATVGGSPAAPQTTAGPFKDPLYPKNCRLTKSLLARCIASWYGRTAELSAERSTQQCRIWTRWTKATMTSASAEHRYGLFLPMSPPVEPSGRRCRRITAQTSHKEKELAPPRAVTVLNTAYHQPRSFYSTCTVRAHMHTSCNI